MDVSLTDIEGLWTLQMGGGPPPSGDFVYVRPGGGSFLYNRPDGTSIYFRP